MEKVTLTNEQFATLLDIIFNAVEKSDEHRHGLNHVDYLEIALQGFCLSYEMTNEVLAHVECLRKESCINDK